MESNANLLIAREKIDALEKEIESLKQINAAELLALKNDYEIKISLNKKKIWVMKIIFRILFVIYFRFSYSVRTVVKKGFYIAAYLFRTAAKNAKGFIGKRTNHHAETSEADRKMRINSECKLRHYNQELYC